MASGGCKNIGNERSGLDDHQHFAVQERMAERSPHGLPLGQQTSQTPRGLVRPANRNAAAPCQAGRVRCGAWALIRWGTQVNIWYPHYPGDYGRDTAHLSLVQHGAYRLLLDHYYSTGSPLPSDVITLHRICRAFDQTERDAVDSVLAQFFDLRADGYHNSRADLELARRMEIRERLSNAGKKRWHKPKDEPGLSQAIAKPQSHPQSQSLVTPIREEERKAFGD